MSEPAESNRPAVSIDPAVLAGTPCLAGTRIPAHLIASTTWHDGVEQAKQTWNLTSHQVLVACWYTTTHQHTQTHTPPRQAARQEGTYKDTDHGHDTDHGDGVEHEDEQEWKTAWEPWAEAVFTKLWLGEVDHLPHPPTKPAPR